MICFFIQLSQITDLQPKYAYFMKSFFSLLFTMNHLDFIIILQAFGPLTPIDNFNIRIFI